MFDAVRKVVEHCLNALAAGVRIVSIIAYQVIQKAIAAFGQQMAVGPVCFVHIGSKCVELLSMKPFKIFSQQVIEVNIY